MDHRARGVATDDAARAVGAEDWRNQRWPARRAARRLHAAGVLESVHDGGRVDPSTATGRPQVRRP